AGLRGGGLVPARLAVARHARAGSGGTRGPAWIHGRARNDPGDRRDRAAVPAGAGSAGMGRVVPVFGFRLFADGLHRPGRGACAESCRTRGRASATMTASVFVTGTDTGIGKTLSSCTLLHALR